MGLGYPNHPVLLVKKSFLSVSVTAKNKNKNKNKNFSSLRYASIYNNNHKIKNHSQHKYCTSPTTKTQTKPIIHTYLRRGTLKGSPEAFD